MDKVTSETKSPKKNKPFWQRNFLTLFLLVLLAVSVGWGYFAKRLAVNDYIKKIEVLDSEHQAKLIQIKEENVKQLSSTLALAIRSAMIDENMSEVVLYFNQSLKTFQVEKFMLIDQNTGKVIISTNKKDENEIFKGEKLVNAKDAIIEKFDDHTYASTPIMGLNTQLAVLVIQLN